MSLRTGQDAVAKAKLKVTIVSVHFTNSYAGNEGFASFIHNLGTRWRLSSQFHSPATFPRLASVIQTEANRGQPVIELSYPGSFIYFNMHGWNHHRKVTSSWKTVWMGSDLNSEFVVAIIIIIIIIIAITIPIIISSHYNNYYLSLLCLRLLA